MNELVKKIASAALAVGGNLSADKSNVEQGYNYLSADKILGICGQALFNQGIVIIPVITEQEVKLYEYSDAYGKQKKRYDSRINLTFRITDGTETQELTWFGMGSDYSVPDKALYKAITSGHKYFLMKLLCVGAGNEDGEHEGGEGVQKKQRAKRTQPEPPSPPPAGNGKKPETATRPYLPEIIKAKLLFATKQITGLASDKQRSLLVMLFEKCLAGDGSELKRHAVQMYLYGVESMKDVPDNLVLASLNTWMKPVQDSGGDYAPDPMAAREVVLVYDAALREQGQMDMPLGGDPTHPG